MKELQAWSEIYELNFQFWPEQCACYISRGGVEIADLGGNYSVREVIELTCQKLRKMNPAAWRSINAKIFNK